MMSLTRYLLVLACLGALLIHTVGCMGPALGDQAGSRRVIVSLEGLPLGEGAGEATRQYVQQHVAPLAPDVVVLHVFRFQPSFTAEVTPRGISALTRLPGVRQVAEDSISRTQSAAPLQ